MEQFNDILTTISSALWGWPMIILLLGTHLFLTIRLRVPQRKIFTAIKLSVSKDKGADGDVSQFGALATALAATIGTGNIIGVATAIALGGPGAVLWCWLTGVFGIATKYSEGLLAIKYRVKTSDGTMLGGPMYALERGLGWKWLAILFAFFTACAAFGIGNTAQANSIATLGQTAYGISPYLTGGVIALLTAVVILGGRKEHRQGVRCPRAAHGLVLHPWLCLHPLRQWPIRMAGHRTHRPRGFHTRGCWWRLCRTSRAHGGAYHNIYA